MSTFWPCPKTLQETEIIGCGLIDLAEEILMQRNVQAVLVWVVLATFSQTYSYN